MTRITLGFKAFDPHELLCHFVATQAKLYRREQIEVELADITFVPDEQFPPDWFQASCGAALMSALKGLGQTVLFVAVDRPMFWIWCRTELEGVSGLAQRRLATFPAAAPPHGLANVILQRAGLDAGKDVTLLPARDDVARLGLLRSGSADAAVVSSAVPPARMAARGYHPVCFFGDELRLPTTGLATHQNRLRQEPELARTLAGIHRESLRLIHDDPAFTAAVLTEWFDIDSRIARSTAELYASAFTADGHTAQDIAEGAIAAVCGLLGMDTRPPWNEVYRLDH